MKIKLNHCKDLGDWYTIIRARHDGGTWMEQTGPNSFQYMCSERLSPEACIEGDASEMIAIAHGINSRKSVSFKRCAVYFDDDCVYFSSPRNSGRAVAISYEHADELAAQILNELSDKAMSAEDICPKCNKPWVHHEFAVPSPYCP